MKKIGGVRIAMQRVDDGKCVCGKENELCSADWDAKLGITSHAADSYKENLNKQRRAEMQGMDPYCFRARLASYGYVRHWTPNRPVDSLDPTPKHVVEHKPKHVEEQHGKGASSRNQRGRGTGSATTGSGRRGKRKSIRRKR